METQQNKGKQDSMKLIAALAPARAEIEVGVVAKADQYWNNCTNCIMFVVTQSLYPRLLVLVPSLYTVCNFPCQTQGLLILGKHYALPLNVLGG